uniref:Protein kinase domain-containing protein n=1 Tax=Sander lucioperca TaxID=283035 RepID=A0A8C9ZCY2_SANLU
IPPALVFPPCHSPCSGKSCSSASLDTDLQVIRGSRLSSESSDYLVLDLIGQGAFAKVAKCVKSATNETVAVKIRKKRSATEAEEEDAILQKLRAFDPDTWHFVRWDSSFIYKAHLCQEFELLDMNLKEFVNMRHTSSLPLRDIRPILHQVATALQLLKSLGISHSDLKPENIMLVDHVRQPLKIKLIDFGSACDASKAEQGSCIQHRWYRAPETILGLPCNEAIDMWSLGCIAAELFLGFPLYPGSCDYERIWKITQTQGQLPGYFLKADTVRDKADLENFVELVKQMLQLDPTQRITPGQVLQHAFVTVSHLIDFCCPQSLSSDEVDAEPTQEPPSENQLSKRSSFGTQSPQHILTRSPTISR